MTEIANVPREGVAYHLGRRHEDANGNMQLYRLVPPLVDEWHGTAYEYVIVSAAVVSYSGPETYIFGADADGEITSWTELEGSFRGGLDHLQALENAGYTTVVDEDPS